MARARTNPWLVLLVLTTGFFMILLDTTIVNVAIPAMSTGLNTTLDQILWVLNAYILVFAVLLITAGRLGDLYGQRTLFAVDRAAVALCSKVGPAVSDNVGSMSSATWSTRVCPVECSFISVPDPNAGRTATRDRAFYE